MLLGPIFSLELVTSARRTRYFLTRAIYAVVLLLGLWVTYAIQRPDFSSLQGIANLAHEFFAVFAVMQMLAVLLLAPPMIAGTIAQERERRTLEYLLTSQLTSSDIVVGKFGARLIHVVLVLLAGIPVLSLSMLLGGVSPEALVAVTLTTVATLVLVGALSILASVRARRPRDAVIRTYLLLFGLHMIPLLGSKFAWYWGQPGFWGFLGGGFGAICARLVAFDPVVIVAGIGMIGLQRFAASIPLQISTVLGTYLVCAAGCLVAGVLSLRRTYAKSEGKAARRRWRWRSRRPAIKYNPVFWREVFVERGLRLGWPGRIVVAVLVLLIASYLVPLFFFTWTGRRDHDAFQALVMATADALACLSLLMCATRAATAVTSEKELDAWVSLLSTPLSAREIVSGKLWGSINATRPVILVVALLGVAAALMDPGVIIMLPFFLVTWLMLLLFSANLGIRFSQSCSTSTRAMFATLALGFFVGGGYLMCLLPVFAAAGPGADALNWLLVAGLIPMLLYAPGMIWKLMTSGFMSSDFTGATFSFIIGIVGYTVAAFMLWSSNVHEFDRRAGRIDPRIKPPPTMSRMGA